jgi:hypothetical protein
MDPEEEEEEEKLVNSPPKKKEEVMNSNAEKFLNERIEGDKDGGKKF